MKKIVFVNRYYRPDHSATAQLLTDLAEQLVRQGMAVAVVTSRQLYQDASATLPARAMLAGVDVHRVWTSRFGRDNLVGRLCDYLSFYASSFFAMLRLINRGDVLVVKTDPPLLSIVGAITARVKGAVLINWLQDLFPEVARELGIGVNARIYRALEWARNRTLKAAHGNVVLGERMAERVNRCTNAPRKTHVIHNWVLDADIHPVARELNPLRQEWNLADKFVIGYSGNLGRAHDYQTILDTARKLQHRDDIVFLFIGSGAGLTSLRQSVDGERLPNVIFKPYQSMAMLNSSLSVPDVHWVSLAPALEGLIVPSKIYGVLAAGRPLLFIGARDSEIAQAIKHNEFGLAVTPGDSAAVVDWVLRLAADSPRLKILSQHARSEFDRHYSYGISLEKWRRLLASSIGIAS